EAVAIGRSIEGRLRDEAKGRQGRPGQERSGKLPEHDKGDTRDKVGEPVGMSGKTYQKARAVVEAAEEDPEAFGPVAEEMDRTGKVDAAYKKVKGRARARRPRPAPDLVVETAAAPEPTTARQNTVRKGVSLGTFRYVAGTDLGDFPKNLWSLTPEAA